MALLSLQSMVMLYINKPVISYIRRLSPYVQKNIRTTWQSQIFLSVYLPSVCLSVSLPVCPSVFLSNLFVFPSHCRMFLPKFVTFHLVYFQQVSRKDIYGGTMKIQTMTTAIEVRCQMVDTLTTRWLSTAVARTDTLQTPLCFPLTHPSYCSSWILTSANTSRGCTCARNFSSVTQRTGPCLETGKKVLYHMERSEGILDLITVIILDTKRFRQFAGLL